MSAVPAIVRACATVAAEACGAPLTLVFSSRQFKRATIARSIAMGMVRHGPVRIRGEAPSFHWIGQHFRRDHSTVIHAVQRYRAWCGDLGLDVDWSELTAVEHAALVAAHPQIAAAPPPWPRHLQRHDDRQRQVAAEMARARTATAAFDARKTA
jgi:hypothetical protein